MMTSVTCLGDDLTNSSLPVGVVTVDDGVSILSRSPDNMLRDVD